MEVDIRIFIQSNETVLYDGAKGTTLGKFIEPGQVTDILNITNPTVVTDLHKAYVDAGSVIIETNTFQGSVPTMTRVGFGSRVYDINYEAARLARVAAGKRAYVVGVVGPTGELLDPLGDITFEGLKEAFRPQILGLLDGGAHIIHIETMSYIEEAEAAIQVVRQYNEKIPIMVTFTFDLKPRGFYTMMGIAPQRLITLSDEYGLLAYGANCGIGPDSADKLVKELRGNRNDALLVMKLNAGKPELINDITVYPGTPEDMALYALEMKQLGVKMIGACCGSTPKHVKAMGEALGI